MKQLKRVVALTGHSYSWGRGVLRGIGEYLREKRHWLLFAEPTQLKPIQVLEQLEAIDGLIINTPDMDVCSRLVRRKIPFVNFNGTMYRNGVRAPCVPNDEAAIGKDGAEHFADLGFKNFAFCGVSAPTANLSRCEYFLRHVGRLSAQQQRIDFHYSYSPLDLNASSRNRLAQWLLSLPKPVGVMAYNDLIARHISEACLISGIRVPQQVAILGVDNDDLVCELATPPLSSIDVNAVKQGYIAAGLLDKWMHGKPPGRVRVWIKPARVVARQSTEIVAVDDTVVSRAMSFILANYHQPVNVEDIVEHVEVSRRKLEYRFKAALSSTPLKELMRMRIRRARELLASTSQPVAAISKQCGFSRANYFAEAFTRENQVSPAEYRAQVR